MQIAGHRNHSRPSLQGQYAPSIDFRHFWPPPWTIVALALHIISFETLALYPPSRGGASRFRRLLLAPLIYLRESFFAFAFTRFHAT